MELFHSQLTEKHSFHFKIYELHLIDSLFYCIIFEEYDQFDILSLVLVGTLIYFKSILGIILCIL